jgi:glycosyltransferase involved in cell wall biosynthesis
VALVAPLVSAIADPFLGGSQALLADLATGLATAGHGVTLFAADGSQVPGVEVPRLGIDPAPFAAARHGLDTPDTAAAAARQRIAFMRIAYEIRRRKSEFDVVHNHAFDRDPFELLTAAHEHVVHTLHLPAAKGPVASAARQAAETGATLVTVSNWAAATWQPLVGPIEVVRNGVPVSRIPVGTNKSGWLFVGRLAPEKGALEAIAAAEQAGHRLRLIAPIYDPAYAEHARPHLARHEVLGAIPRAAVFAEMARAQVLLMPVKWDEPFGLTAVEAMAAGTPVVAYARGALPEIVANGITGFLVAPGDLNDLAAAAGRAEGLDPARCRAWALENFDLDRMVADHVRLYATLATW